MKRKERFIFWHFFFCIFLEVVVMCRSYIFMRKLNKNFKMQHNSITEMLVPGQSSGMNLLVGLLSSDQNNYMQIDRHHYLCLYIGVQQYIIYIQTNYSNYIDIYSDTHMHTQIYIHTHIHTQIYIYMLLCLPILFDIINWCITCNDHCRMVADNPVTILYPPNPHCPQAIIDCRNMG